MRLTLRTLLAYLDDVLEPADTKTIGLKIQESPMAQLLVSRIRDVMRRRRLKAPEVFGPEMGIDPNIVAQYLDTTLPAERYADVERVLLASDEMLAEAAACHQVLPVWLANPIEVSPTSRERLYALGPVDASSQLSISGEQTSVAAKLSSERNSVRNGTVSIGSPSSGFTNGAAMTPVPDYLKRSPWYQRLFPSALVALVVVACIGMLAPGIITGLRQAKNEIQRREDRDKEVSPSVPVDQASSDETMAKPVESGPQLDVPAVLPTQALAGAVLKKLPHNLDPAAPKDDFDEIPVPAPSLPTTRMSDGPVPVSTVQDRSAKGAATSELPAALNPVSVPHEIVADVPIAYASMDGVLLHLDQAQQRWFMVPHRSAMKPGEFLANIEPFEAVLDFEKGNLKVTLLGETVINLLKPADVGVNAHSKRSLRR